jgi:hypothetical protein
VPEFICSSCDRVGEAPLNEATRCGVCGSPLVVTHCRRCNHVFAPILGRSSACTQCGDEGLYAPTAALGAPPFQTATEIPSGGDRAADEPEKLAASRSAPRNWPSLMPLLWLQTCLIRHWPSSLLYLEPASRGKFRKFRQRQWIPYWIDCPCLAKRMASLPDDLHLDTLRAVRTDVAAQLATTRHALWLSGLSTLEVTVARALARHRGRGLYLDGIGSLTEEIAQHLAAHRGRGLSLNGLVSVSTAAAKHLARYRGCLRLDGVTNLSTETATALAGHRGPWISLGGLTRISLGTAQALAGYRGREIKLNGLGLDALDPSILQAISAYPGDVLVNGMQLKLTGLQQTQLQPADGENGTVDHGETPTDWWAYFEEHAALFLLVPAIILIVCFHQHIVPVSIGLAVTSVLFWLFLRRS